MTRFIVYFVLFWLIIDVGFCIYMVFCTQANYKSKKDKIKEKQNKFKEEYNNAESVEEKRNVLNKYLTQEDIDRLAFDWEKSIDSISKYVK